MVKGAYSIRKIHPVSLAFRLDGLVLAPLFVAFLAGARKAHMSSAIVTEFGPAESVSESEKRIETA